MIDIGPLGSLELYDGSCEDHETGETGGGPQIWMDHCVDPAVAPSSSNQTLTCVVSIGFCFYASKLPLESSDSCKTKKTKKLTHFLQRSSRLQRVFELHLRHLALAVPLQLYSTRSKSSVHSRSPLLRKRCRRLHSNWMQHV